jgi:hypothetical protein
MALTLGDVLFRDFEIPSKLSAAIGGKQSLGKHRLLGGARVTDAMGDDPDDPSWEGRFRGANAESRAQQLDAIRKAGQEVLLTFGSFQYTVVIEEFVCDYMQRYEIPYRIKCYITQVDTVAAPASLDDLVSSDNAALSSQVTKFGTNQQSLETGVASLPGNVA